MDQSEIPGDWDTLAEREPGNLDSMSPPDPDYTNERPPVMTLMASSWADLVAILAVCTAALIAVMVLGNRPALPVFGWAAVLAVVWWSFAAAATVLVRQGTPGMLLAGLSFKDQVDPARIGLILTAALVGVLTLGLPGLLGGKRSILPLAAASELTTDGMS